MQSEVNLETKEIKTEKNESNNNSSCSTTQLIIIIVPIVVVILFCAIFIPVYVKNHDSDDETEDILAIKKLVDTFSTLADVKDVESQMDLFTDDAEVISKSGGQTFTSRGKEEIGQAFADYLALFDIVYHLNGQQTVEINGDEATGTSYCFVVLIGNGIKNQSGVRYKDTYVKKDGKWLIKRRESDFTFTSVDPYNTS